MHTRLMTLRTAPLLNVTGFHIFLNPIFYMKNDGKAFACMSSIVFMKRPFFVDELTYGCPVFDVQRFFALKGALLFFWFFYLPRCVLGRLNFVYEGMLQVIVLERYESQTPTHIQSSHLNVDYFGSIQIVSIVEIAGK